MSDEASPNSHPFTRPKPRVRAWVVRIALFVGVFVAVSYYQRWGLLPTGEPAPAFEASLLNGERVRLSDFRGKPLLLHFWATWCGVCRQEFSALNRLQASLGDEATLLAVVADSDAPNLDDFVQAQGLSYPIVRANRALLEDYKIQAFPTNYFVDGAGMIQSVTVGMSTSWAMRARLACSN